jgi:subtilisin-like proprotein convertase family protein
MPLVDSIAVIFAALTLASVASAQAVQCAGAGTAIPDGGSGVSVVVTMPSDPGATVENVLVSVDLAHEWLGDLTITISHDGASVVLIDRVASDIWSYGCGGDDIDADFTDSATVSAEQLCNPGGPTPMFFGDLLPEEALSVFKGLPVEGDWIITVTDHNPIDTGVINSICVTVVAAPSGCAGDVNGDGTLDLGDLSLVLSNFGQMTVDGDATGDGVVDLEDLSVVLSNFGADC